MCRRSILLVLVLLSFSSFSKDVSCLSVNKFDPNEKFLVEINYENGVKSKTHWSAKGPKAPMIVLSSYSGDGETVDEALADDSNTSEMAVLKYCNVRYDPTVCRNDFAPDHDYYAFVSFAADFRQFKKVNWLVSSCHGNNSSPFSVRREMTFGPTLPNGEGPVPELKTTACFLECKVVK